MLLSTYSKTFFWDFCILLTRGVACCDESNRHRNSTRVNFRYRCKKFPSSIGNGYEFYSNGFGQLNACIFQEKYEKNHPEIILA